MSSLNTAPHSTRQSNSSFATWSPSLSGTQHHPNSKECLLSKSRSWFWVNYRFFSSRSFQQHPCKSHTNAHLVHNLDESNARICNVRAARLSAHKYYRYHLLQILSTIWSKSYFWDKKCFSQFVFSIRKRISKDMIHSYLIYGVFCYLIH